MSVNIKPLSLSPIGSNGGPFGYNAPKVSSEGVKSLGVDLVRLVGKFAQAYPISLSPIKAPVVGWNGTTFNESLPKILPVNISMPSDVTQFTLLLQVKLEESGAMKENLKFELVDPVGVTATIYHAYSSGAVGTGVNVGTGYKFIEVQGVLPVAFIAQAGEIGNAQFRVTAKKTNPRTQAPGMERRGYWDGLLSCVFRVY